MQGQIQAYNAHQMRQQVQQFRKVIQEDGDVELDFHWRPLDGTGQWRHEHGRLSLNNNILTWHGDDGLLHNNWPPNNIDIGNMQYTLMSNINRHIQNVATTANENTAAFTRGAASILQTQADRLEREQQLFEKDKQDFATQTANLRAAQEDVRIRQKELLEERKKFDEEYELAQAGFEEENAADIARQQEFELKKQGLEKDRLELEAEKQTYATLRKKLHEGLRAQTERDISTYTCRSGPATATAPSTPRISDQPLFQTSQPRGTSTTQRMNNMWSSQPPTPVAAQANPPPTNRRIVVDDDPPSRRAPARGPVSEDDIEDVDWEDVATSKQPSSIQSLKSAGNDGVIIETEAFALNPDLLTSENTERLLTYLRQHAAPKGKHWSDHVIADVITTLRGILIMLLADSDLITNEGWQLIARTSLKRIIMSKLAAEGKAAAYVNAFASAVEGGSRPEWVRNAQRQALRETKEESNATKSQTTKRGKGKKDSK